MRIKQTAALVLAIMALGMISCTGKEGPMGPQGPAGTSGISLIGTHTGTMPSTAPDPGGDLVIDVPEILNRQSDTFIEAYFAYSDSPDEWTLMADGWVDSVDTSRTCAISWSAGEVKLYGMETGDLYLIKVFQHD